MKANHLRSGLIWTFVMGLLLAGVQTQPSYAHPHYWMNLKADMILDDQGRLAAIRQRWAFDAYFSMMTVADAVNEHGDKETGLRNMADQIIANLAKYQYLSVLTINGTEIDLPQPSVYQLTENTQLEQPVLELEMRFDIASPLIIKGKDLVWSVFDPTYYIAMNYSKVENISIKGANNTQCQLTLSLPNPSSELTEYAQSLDRTQKDTGGLGKSFAEKVRIHCV